MANESGVFDTITKALSDIFLGDASDDVKLGLIFAGVLIALMISIVYVVRLQINKSPVGEYVNPATQTDMQSLYTMLDMLTVIVKMSVQDGEDQKKVLSDIIVAVEKLSGKVAAIIDRVEALTISIEDLTESVAGTDFACRYRNCECDISNDLPTHHTDVDRDGA